MKHTPTEKRRLRNSLANYLAHAEKNRAAVHYSQARPYHGLGVEPTKGFTADCSSYVTLACYWAQEETGLDFDDPNGRRYDGYGFCHEPSARLLTTDLRWVAAGDTKAGDELWTLDANTLGGNTGSARRRFRRGIVVASFGSKKDCVRVCLDTDETFICSSDHPWLSKMSDLPGSRRRWIRADQLLRSPILVRPFMPWDPEGTYEAGWLAGMFDGEGWVRNRGARGGRTQMVEAIQTEGQTCDRLVATAQRYGSFLVSRRQIKPGARTTITISSNGAGMAGAASFLGRIRPERLISNFEIEGGYVDATFPARVVGVERVGHREVQSIQTTTGTYIAEGFAVHNTGTLLHENLRHPVPPDHDYLVGDLALYGPAYATRHVVICRMRGTAATSIWSSHGSEAGPLPVRLRYRSDLLIVLRPEALL